MFTSRREIIVIGVPAAALAVALIVHAFTGMLFIGNSNNNYLFFSFRWVSGTVLFVALWGLLCGIVCAVKDWKESA